MIPTKRFSFARPISALLRTILVALLWSTASLDAGDRVPGDVWMQYKVPEQAGFSSRKLGRAKKLSEKSGSAAVLVVYDGAVVAAWGDVDRRFMCHSMRKSILSALYGIQIDKGVIDPNKSLKALNIDDIHVLTAAEKQARIFDLLRGRSGVYHPAAYETAGMKARRPERGSHAPGAFFYYNNWDFNTLLTIYEQETTNKFFEDFQLNLALPLQMQDFRLRDGYYHFEPEQSRHPAYPLRMSTRDLARFGLLYMRKGRWGDQTLLPSHWVDDSTKAFSQFEKGGGYGFLWWINGDPRFAPYQMYSALGAGGHAIDVLPELNLVFVHRPDTYAGKVVDEDQRLAILAQVIAAKVGEAQTDPELVPLPPTKQTVASYDPGEIHLRGLIRNYHLPNGGRVAVTLKDGQLVATTPSGVFGLIPLSPDAFLLEDALSPVYLRQNEAGYYQMIEENLCNQAGYQLLAAGKTDEAIAVLRQAVTFFPDSFNAHDSLGEALLAAGLYDEALAAYRRSLELNRKNSGAKAKIKEIKRAKKLNR